MMRLSKALTVAKKDFKAYFNSVVAYVLLTTFSGVMGFMFVAILNSYVDQSSRPDRMQMGRTLSLVDNLIKPIFGNMNVIFLFVIPAITMRLIAEEKRNNTIELLMTSPLNLSEIIFGKYLSAWAFAIVMIAMTLPYPFTLYLGAKPDWAVVMMSYMGTILMVGLSISIGIFFSSLTDNQIIAYITTFGSLLLLWILNWAAYSSSTMMADVLRYVSVIDHFEDFSRGVFNTKDLVFFLSAIFFWLFLSYKALESHKWRA